MIRKENGKWVLYSKDGKKKLGGPYATRQQAVKRERQVQFFKRQGEVEDPSEDFWVTADEMRAICPDCADGMAHKGLSRVNLALADVERGGPGDVHNLSKHVRNRCGGDPGFFTCCMTVAAIDGYDRETRAAVCARVHKIITGIWPGEHKQKKADVEDGEMSANEERAGLERIDLIITKANVGADGTPRWLAVASDTGVDKTGESTSLGLFQDWAERIDKSLGVPFLDPPRKPFLGVSHYSDLDGFGEAGITDKMYIDGKNFKAAGSFFTDDDHPLGPILFQAVSNERDFIKRGGEMDQPIRISAAWWDLQHAHGDFIFTRQSLTHKCPMCAKGTGNKVYLKGQLDHFATTRVPINPRTSLLLEEKSMATTRKEDAATIVGDELAEELEKRSKLVGKSETESADEGLIIKADEEKADEQPEPKTAKKGRGTKKTTKAKQPETPVQESDEPEAVESEAEVEAPETPPEPVEVEQAEVEKAGEKNLFGKKKAKKGKKAMADDSEDDDMEADSEEEDEEESEKKADLAAILEGLDQEKALTALSEAGLIERMPEADMMEVMPLGGATSIADAEAAIAAREQVDQVHDNFGLFMTVMGNIMSQPDDEGKLDMISRAIGDFGDRIDALKSGLADAYLLQPTYTAADEIEAPQITKSEGENMSEQVETQATEQPQDMYDALKAAVDSAVANPEMNRAEKAEIIQKALGEFVQVVKGDLDQQGPADVADVVAKALEPIAEKMALIEAKLNAPAPVQEPQQKSLATVKGSPVNGPAPADMAAGLSIKDIARRSVGLQ